MNPNVVSQDYLNLQKAIMDEQEKLVEDFNLSQAEPVNQDDLNFELPVLPQLKESPVQGDSFREALYRIESVLSAHEPVLKKDLSRLVSSLTDDDIVRWIKETVTYNTGYFQSFAEKYELPEWLPHFLAEQALRPFMQVLARRCRPFINDIEVMGTCPCCGEPHRLAKLDRNDHRFLYCPRCETEWRQRKSACVHCGDDRDGHLFYINIKEDAAAKIEICETCNNYLKIVETTKMPEDKSAALLDLETIHLDFVAQEEGYGDEPS